MINTKKNLILASQSPRRKELMESLELPFTIQVADVDETLPNLPFEEAIQVIAQRKAQVIAKQNPDALVIGADTLVVLGQEVLGKPKTEEKAVEMLRLLSGKTHQVLTGVALATSEKTKTFVSVSEVTFHSLSEEEIHEYVKTKEPLDKAGAYGIQGKAGRFIDKINGDYYSIMGLPVAALYQSLKEFSD